MKEQTWPQWARVCVKDPSSPSRLKKGALAALTGQDVRALNAFVAALQLYSNSDENGERGALAAMRALLPAMQRSTQWIARELIPFVLDWDDREKLWPLICPQPARRGEFYPRGACANHTGYPEPDVREGEDYADENGHDEFGRPL